MSELKHQLMLNKHRSWVPCYLKSEADKVIAELEESHMKEVEQFLIEIVKLKAENERLKSKLESVQATAYADSVDAGMLERRLKRSLWLARAERARLEWTSISYGTMLTEFNYSKAMQVYAALGMFYDIWKKVERKCREKSKEYL